MIRALDRAARKDIHMASKDMGRITNMGISQVDMGRTASMGIKREDISRTSSMGSMREDMDSTGMRRSGMVQQTFLTRVK